MKENSQINNFNVSVFGEDTIFDTRFYQKHHHEYFEIIWLNNGTGIHKIDMKDHFYNGSVLFFLAPGQVHKIIPHTRTQGYVLKFMPSVFKQERDFIDYIFDTCLLDTDKSCPVISIPPGKNDLIEELFIRLVKEFNQQQTYADIILSSYLKILTTQIRRIKDTYISRQQYIYKPQYDLFREYKIAVERHYKTMHNVKDYAIQLNTQARTLNTLARKYGNKSALEIIQDRIVLEAKRKLYHSSASIKELGYELGFEDPAYFTRFFKKNVGTAPRHFKTNSTEISTPLFA